MGLLAKEFEQIAVIHIEAEIARGGVEIGTVNEQGNPFTWQEMHGARPLEAASGTSRKACWPDKEGEPGRSRSKSSQFLAEL